MSGGHFDYQQYKINDIASEIERCIETNDKEDRFGYKRNYSEETISLMREAVLQLRKASIYAQRVDWLLSDDDGEENFKKRLNSELSELTCDDTIIDVCLEIYKEDSHNNEIEVEYREKIQEKELKNWLKEKLKSYPKRGYYYSKTYPSGFFVFHNFHD